MANFDFYNINFSKSDRGNQLVIRGEIKNNSGRNYNAVALRVVLFSKNIPMVNTVIVVNGLPNGVSKGFEKYVEEIDYDQVAKQINRHEVLTESAY
jgi:hypothetical protein